MKILWLAPYPHPSEPAAHPVPWVGTLAELLRRQPGVELTILNWTHRIDKPVDEFDRDGMHFIYLKVPKVRTDILTLYQWRIAIVKKYLRQHYKEYDVLHLHGSELQLPAMTAGLPAPMVLSVQGIVSEYAKVVPKKFSMLKFLWTLAGFYEKRYLPTVHNFSCRTDWDKSHTKRLSPGARIFHNWETIRPEFFEEADKPAPPQPARPQALFVGGKQEIKGFKEMLMGFDLIRQQAPELRLVIVGRLNPADVAAVATQYNLQHIGPEHVECRPFQTGAGLARLCRESFCLLHPSYIDNSPNSVCEAQLMGLPVVASDVGGVASLITEGETGLLCDLTPASLARQTLRLYHDPALRQRIVTQAQAVAQERHNPDTIIQRTVAMYEAVRDSVPTAAAAPAVAATA
ncbi:glycosyltransferase family 4 protein [Hymenobacter defluvii]|uniref:Glycosyltransferase n=1 Tax=Hymenobacter defluvii TaxID=2054411 RepID=A0ABS3TDT9_9BACT|nr:glycosyltransferase [Hymenobacter defluvii]MBO3271820.1 glycosyltransferase [Hymenobacter defluvii]